MDNAGAARNWRTRLHHSIRATNRALLAPVIYESSDAEISIEFALFMAITIEGGFYQEAMDEREYLEMISHYIQMIQGTRGISQEKGTMPEMKSPIIARRTPIYSFDDLFQRQIEVTGYLKKLLYLFNRRLPKARTPRQQTLIRMHKLMSCTEFMEDLDSVTQQIDDARKEADECGLSDDEPMRFHEGYYEMCMKDCFQEFSGHITKNCNCLVEGAVDDPYLSSHTNFPRKHECNYAMFLNPIPQPPLQPQQQPQPRQQQQQLDPNENLVIDTIYGALQAEFDDLFDEHNETQHP